MADDTILETPQRINIRNDKGGVRNVAPEELGQAHASGWHNETMAEAIHRKKEEKYGGVLGTIEAGVAGALRGPTFGGSDVAATKLGLVSPETLADLKEVDPVASTIGEIVGTGGAALLGGAAGAGVKLASGVASSIEGKIAGMIGKSALARLIATGAGTSAEGALYGAGQLLSEDALGDHDMTAEHILSTVGLSALLGGGVATGLHGAGAAIKAGVSAVRSGTEKAAELSGKVFSWAGHDVDADVMRTAVTGEAGGAEGTITGKITRPGLDVTPDAFRNQSMQLQDGLQNVIDTVKSLKINASNARPKEVRQILEAAEDNGVPYQRALEVMGETRKSLSDMLEGSEAYTYDKSTVDRILRYVQGVPDKEGNPSAASVMGQIGKSADQADVFDALNEFKRKLYAEKDVSESQYFNLDVPQRNTLKRVQDIYSQVQKHLEDPEIYGEAGSRQAAYNRAIAEFATAEKKFKRQFFVAGELEPRKVGTYLRQIDAGAGMRANNALTDYLDKATSYIGEAGKTLADTGADPLESANTLNAVTQAKLQKVQALEALGQMSRLRAVGFGMPMAGGDALLEGMIHMGPQSLTGLAISTAKNLMRPQGVVKILGAVNRYSKMAQEKIIANAEELLATKTGKTLSGLAGPIAAQVGAAAKDDFRPASVKSQAMNYMEIARNPNLLQNKIAGAIQGLDQAGPKLAGNLATKMTTAFLYLAQKAQEMGTPQMSPFSQADTWDVPRSRIAQFGRYIRAVEDPFSVLRDVHAGRLSPEGVESLSAVYGTEGHRR